MAKRPRMTKHWWLRAEPLYRRFMHESFCGRDAAEAQQMFQAETYGDCIVSADNRYANGKKWLGVTVAMWKAGVADGTLTKVEIIDDKTFKGLGDWAMRAVAAFPPSEQRADMMRQLYYR